MDDLPENCRLAHRHGEAWDSLLRWPPSMAEMNLGGEVQIKPEDIDSYAYPPGERKRYTFAGWGKAIDLGVAVLRVEDFGARRDE